MKWPAIETKRTHTTPPIHGNALRARNLRPGSSATTLRFQLLTVSNYSNRDRGCSRDFSTLSNREVLNAYARARHA